MDGGDAEERRTTMACSGKAGYTWDEKDAYPDGIAPPTASENAPPSSENTQGDREKRSRTKTDRSIRRAKEPGASEQSPVDSSPKVEPPSRPSKSSVEPSPKQKPPSGEAKVAGGGDNLFEQLLAKEMAAHGMKFDEIPAEAEEKNFDNVPLEDRLVSHSWEARVSGLTTLKEQIVALGDWPITGGGFRQVDMYGDEFAKWIVDKNLTAQKVAIELMIEWVARAEEKRVKEIWETLWKSVFEKVLTTPKVQKVGEDLCVMCVEVGGGKLVVDSMVSFLEGKLDKKGNPQVKGPQTKQVVNVLNAICRLMTDFGANVIQPSSFVSKVQKFTGVTDKGIKEASYNILCSVYLLVKNVAVVTSGMGEKQAAEVERRCTAKDGESVPEPSRKLRSGADNASKGAAGGGAFNARELLEEVDIMKLLGVERFEKAIQSAANWKQKREQLDGLLELCEQHLRLKVASDYSTVVSVLCRLIQLDSNIVVVSTSLKICSYFALGLGKSFERHTRLIVSVTLPRLKDKSKPLIAVAGQFLEDILQCAPFDIFIDDVVNASHDKNPGMKVHCLDWITKAATHPDQKEGFSRWCKKGLSLALEMIEETAPEVRNGAGKLIQALAVKLKVKVLQNAISELSGRARAAAEAAIAEAKANAPEAKSPPHKAESKEMVEDTAPPPESARTSPQGPGPKMPKKRVVKPSKGKTGTDGGRGGVVNEDDVPQCVVDGVLATEAITSLLQEDAPFILELLNKPNWKDKSEGFEGLNMWWYENQETAAPYTDYLAMFAKGKTKDFKESNVNICRSAIDLLANLPEISGSHFTRSAANLILSGVIDRLSDARLGGPVADMLSKYAVHFSPRFVLAVIIPRCRSISSPKLQLELCRILETMIQEFSIEQFNLPFLVDYIKTLIESRVKAIKAAGVSLCVLIYRYTSDVLWKVFGHDVKSHVIDELRAACQKGKEDPMPPRKTAYKGKPPPASEAPTSDVEKVCISEEMSFIIKDLGDSRQKVRKEGFNKLLTALEGTPGRIHASGLASIFCLLRIRLQDSNKTSYGDCLDVLEPLAAALGPDAKKYARSILPPLFATFSEATLRDQVKSVSLKWMEVCGQALWITTLITSGALIDNSNEQKVALLDIIASDHVFFDEVGTEELKVLLAVALDLAGDKLRTVKAPAEVVAEKIAAIVGHDVIRRVYNDLRTAQQGPVKQLVNKLLSTVPDSKSLRPTGDQQSDTFGSGVGNDSLSQADRRARDKDGFVVRMNPSGSSKLRREEQLRGSRWPINLSAEDFDLVHAAFKPHVNDALLGAMFDKTQHNRVVRALEFWRRFVQSADNVQRVFGDNGITDLLFKWITMRMNETNPRVSSVAVEFLKDLLNAYQGSGERVSDFDLHIVGPHLADRVGSSNSTLRDGVRETLGHLAHLANPQQFFIILMRGTSSQNKRTVADCLERIAYLIATFGPTVCPNQERDAVKLATLAVQNPDGAVRTNAMKALAFCHVHMGDVLFDICAVVPDCVERLIAFIEKNPNLQDEINNDETYYPSIPRPNDDCTTPVPEDGDASFRRRRGNYAEDSSADEANRDFFLEFNGYIESCELEEELQEFKQLRNLRETTVLRQRELVLCQGLSEECRRSLEGRSDPVEMDIAYWNGLKRLDEARKPGRSTLRVMAELEKLHCSDADALLDALANIEEMQPSGTRQEWTIAYASELANGFSAALSYTFDPERLQRSTEDRDRLTHVAKKLTECIHRFVKNKRVLLQISPRQLKTLFQHLLIAMSCHPLWCDCPDSELLVKRFNEIIGTNMMSIVTPRTAFQFVEMLCEFTLADDKTVPSDEVLTFKVFGRFIKKLNMRHPTTPTQQDKQHYLRLLDVSLMCLKWVESKQGSLPGEFTREAVETHLRHIIYIVTVVCPRFVGLYFRDFDFLSHRNSAFRERVTQLMNDPSTNDVDSQRGGTKGVEAPPLGLTYLQLHKWHTDKKTGYRLTLPPPDYPEFSIEALIDLAPAEIYLRDMDPTLAAGWNKRRDTQNADVPEIGPLYLAWKSTMDKIRQDFRLSDNQKYGDIVREELDRGYSRSDVVSTYVAKLLDLRRDMTANNESAHFGLVDDMQ